MTARSLPRSYETAVDEIRALQAANWPAQVPQDPTGLPGLVGITDYVWHWAQQTPDAPAVSFYGITWDYRTLADQALRWAGWLQAAGVEPGARVGILAGNCPQFTAIMLGTLAAGCVHVPINPMFREHELTHELTDAGVSVLVAEEPLLPLVRSVLDRTAVRRVLRLAPSAPLVAGGVPLPDVLAAPIEDAAEPEWHAAVAGSVPASPQPAEADALAALNYTGGTTGMPKGCEHTQGDMVYTAVTITAAQGQRVGQERSASIIFVPIFWIAGEDFGILAPLVNGGQVHLLRRWDVSLVLELIEREHATTMLGTVDNYVELLEQAAGRDLSSLHTALAMSFVLKLTPQIRQQWREVTGHVIREASYGMTETHTGDTITLGFQDEDRDLTAEPVFCGLPVPGTDILIVDDELAPVPVGSAGQIIVRSPSLLKGYYGRPDDTAAALHDGWLHTGDTGRLDEWGALHYLGRNKEMIKVNGMSVFPSEVEAILRLHPQVATLAVVPMPDPDRGQRPLAFVELLPEASVTAADLTEWARENMAPYKVPVVEVVSGLPMTATGKVKKGDLFERARERAERP
ncbi:fatty-acyl-CoA synthase/long-chain acyl-CoA synthetase [Branchiibius hedensis]|uniref:Fatty-acyl-CoA synthase n=1 Tax=Branchiibius hedensis TaxID=672460 RepID=A0A2Y8ZV72_9MICO|nr:AMP-binding protein [Branchiibius hedensis]PWJ26366.1 fatty-acyl-CoA synthase/long-chain acyl-CoA synthetase [Branchiibius hedensis]SSA35178.1 fatty-acyl-CoA synthase [Branchiibius hedensis]